MCFAENAGVTVCSCSEIRMKTPYTAKRDKDTVHYTYLDTIGRPVVTLHKDNLVEQHILDFEVVADIFHTTISLIYKLFLLSETPYSRFWN